MDGRIVVVGANPEHDVLSTGSARDGRRSRRHAAGEREPRTTRKTGPRKKKDRVETRRAEAKETPRSWLRQVVVMAMEAGGVPAVQSGCDDARIMRCL